MFDTPDTMPDMPNTGSNRKSQIAGLGNQAKSLVIKENELFRTPTASQGQGGALGEAEARKRGNTVGVRDQVMDLVASQGKRVSRAQINDLLPTTTASDWKGANNSGGPSTSAHGLATKIDNLPRTDWGKFEPAIERWEDTLERTAPAPTKPDGKDGAHRLSSAFTEWMMGLPYGWVTEVGLSRTDELKACGNGVVPQQAELALRILLEGVPIQSVQPSMSMFPTPTVSDVYTDNLKSSQQKEGSMHSVTLPQAVRMVGNAAN